MMHSCELQFVRTELRLLLSLAGCEGRPDQSFAILDQARSGGIKWDYLRSVAVRHGLMPLVSSRLLSDELRDFLPEAEQEGFRAWHQDHARKKLLMTGELLRILELFSSLDISAIPFKGPVLAVKAYGDIALRQYTDLDILLKEGDTRKALDTLFGNGFEPRWISAQGHRHYLTPKRMKAVLKAECHYQVFQMQSRLMVELHWAIVPRFYAIHLDYEDLWTRVQSFELAGKRIQVLSPEDDFLLLCLHSAKHMWERIEWILCLARYVDVTPGLNWDRLVSKAEALGMRRIFLTSVLLCSKFARGPSPQALRERLAGDKAVKALAVKVWKRILDEKETLKEPRSAFAWFRLRERRSDKLRYLGRYAAVVWTPTEKEWNLLGLPDGLFCIYYVLRPLRLVAVYMLKLFRRPPFFNGKK